MDNDVKALVEEARAEAKRHIYGSYGASLITRLADALSARASSDAEKRDAVLVEAAKVASDQRLEGDPKNWDKWEHGYEQACIEIRNAILSLRTDHE